MTDARKFKGFIFDLDGTLLDTLPDLIQITNKTLKHFSFPTRTHDEILSYVGDGAYKLIYRALPECASKKTCEETLEYWTALYPKEGLELTRPYAGLAHTLQQLREKGCKLGVLSNKYEQGVLDVCNKYLPNYFDTLHGEGEGFPRKPDPTGLLKVLDELNLRANESAYVGDSAGDVNVAKRAGCFAVGASWGYNKVSTLKAAGADVIIDTPSELLQFV